MSYVPTPVIVPPSEASWEAKELAREIEEVVIRYQEDHPRTRPEDVRQALGIVSSVAGAGRSHQVRLGFAVVVGTLLLVGLLVGLLLFRTG